METSGPDVWRTWHSHPCCTRCELLGSKGKKGRGVIFSFSSCCLKPLLSPRPPERQRCWGGQGNLRAIAPSAGKRLEGSRAQGWVRNGAWKHEWTWGDTTRCDEWQWHVPQVLYVRVVHASSEFAGGEVWSLCEHQVCLKGRPAAFKKRPNTDYWVLLCAFLLSPTTRVPDVCWVLFYLSWERFS